MHFFESVNQIHNRNTRVKSYPVHQKLKDLLLRNMMVRSCDNNMGHP